jgi:uncharacterized oligopeptide transporter (OPT) family protein
MGQMQLTFRAALAGVLLGALLAAGNVYMGLRTGLWETGVVTATVIAAAVLPVLRRSFDPVEVTLVQAVAVSTGAVPAAAGLLGAVPGLALLGAAPPWWWVVPFGLGAGGLGLVLAHGLRRRLLEEEALPFPSGVAAAEVLRTRGGTGARALGITGLLSAGLTALRESGLFPAAFLVPGRAGELGLGLAVSPMLLGAGAFIGLANAWALALGAGIAWLWLAPALLGWGIVPDGSFASVTGWLLWPGVGLMLGGAVASLARDASAFKSSAADLRIAARGILRSRRLGGLGLLSVALLLISTRAGFGLGLASGALSILPALLAAIACARVTGKTDVAPAGEVGQVVQGAAGAFGLGAVGCTGAGAIAAGVASQSAVALWSLRAGSRTGVQPRAHGRAMLLGLATGAVVVVPLYELFLHAYALGSSELPAPTAVRWRALAELAGGTSALPPGATWALPAAIAAGLLLEVLRRVPGGDRVPSPGVLGLGFLVPAHYAVAMLVGAGLAALATRRRGTRIEPIAAGAIAGESVAALAAGVLAALGLLG